MCLYSKYIKGFSKLNYRLKLLGVVLKMFNYYFQWLKPFSKSILNTGQNYKINTGTQKIHIKKKSESNRINHLAIIRIID